MCALHKHFCKEKGVLKYLINIESFKAEIIVQKCLHSSFETVDCTQQTLDTGKTHHSQDTDTTRTSDARSQNVDNSILLNSRACENTCGEISALSNSWENACTSVNFAGDGIDGVTACSDEPSSGVDDKTSNITYTDKNSNELGNFSWKINIGNLKMCLL